MATTWMKNNAARIHRMRHAKSHMGAEGRQMALEATVGAAKRFETRVSLAYARYTAEREADRAVADQYGIIRRKR